MQISATLQDWRAENIFHVRGGLSLQDSSPEVKLALRAKKSFKVF